MENQSKIETTKPKELNWCLAFGFHNQKEVLKFLDRKFPQLSPIFKKNRAKAIEKGKNYFENYNPKTKGNDKFYINGPFFCSTNKNKVESNITYNQKLQQAKKEMKLYNITIEQKNLAYVKGKSEKAFNNINPYEYGGISQNINRYIRYKLNLGKNKNELLKENNEYHDISRREDAFKLYLGIPQSNNSFGISDYKPSGSKEINKIYFKPNYRSKEMKEYLIMHYYLVDEKESNTMNSKYNGITGKLITNERESVMKEKDNEIDNPLGDFSVMIGKDTKGIYLSVYDKWDLNPFIKGDGFSNNKGNSEKLQILASIIGLQVNENTEISTIFGAGYPFEIYDRIYFDPITKKIKE